MITRRTAVLLGASGAALALAAVAGWVFLPRPAQKMPVGVAEPTGANLVGGPFTLVAGDGRTVTDADFRGKYLLVYFGYTFCPDVCPTTLQSIANVLDKLGDDAKAVVPLFISIDPERDTPAVMAKYVAAFDRRIVGLTGTPAQVATAAKAYRVYYARSGEGEDYLMDHSSMIYLMGPKGRLRAYFTPQATPAAMAATVRKFLATSA